MKVNELKGIAEKAVKVVAITGKDVLIYKENNVLDMIAGIDNLDDRETVIVSPGDNVQEALQLLIEAFGADDKEDYYTRKMQTILSTKEVISNALKFADRAENADIKAELKVSGINFGTLKLDEGMLYNLLTTLSAKKAQLVMDRIGGYKEGLM